MQAVERSGGEVQVGTPRSKRVTGRHVPIPPPAVGLPTLRFHDLRRTVAALKLGQGYGIHDLKEWMGHAAFLSAPTAPVTRLRSG